MSTTLKEAVANAIALRNPALASVYREACPDPSDHCTDRDQIHGQNLFWRRQLEALDGVDTTGLREYLVDECESGVGEWLRLFHTGILPACVSLALPRRASYGRA